MQLHNHIVLLMSFFSLFHLTQLLISDKNLVKLLLDHHTQFSSSNRFGIAIELVTHAFDQDVQLMQTVVQREVALVGKWRDM